MISPKIAMMTAMMAVTTIGMAAVPALAASNGGNGFSLAQVIERNNQIGQNIEQSNEACTNTVVAIEDDSGDQEVEAEQENECLVFQENEAEQEAEIEDESFNIPVNFAGFFD